MLVMSYRSSKGGGIKSCFIMQCSTERKKLRNDFYVFINFMTFWMNSHYHNIPSIELSKWGEFVTKVTKVLKCYQVKGFFTWLELAKSSNKYKGKVYKVPQCLEQLLLLMVLLVFLLISEWVWKKNFYDTNFYFLPTTLSFSLSLIA